MTTNVKQTTQQVQGQTLDYVRQAQETVVKTAQTFAEAWADVIRQFLPGAPGTGNSLNLRDLVDQTFDFGEQLLSTQREFAHRMMQATAPVTRANEEAVEDIVRHLDDGYERSEQIQQAQERSEQIREEANERSERIQQIKERGERIQQAQERSEQIREEANERSERIQQVKERDEQTEEEAKEAPTPSSAQENTNDQTS